MNFLFGGTALNEQRSWVCRYLFLQRALEAGQKALMGLWVSLQSTQLHSLFTPAHIEHAQRHTQTCMVVAQQTQTSQQSPLRGEDQRGCWQTYAHTSSTVISPSFPNIQIASSVCSKAGYLGLFFKNQIHQRFQYNVYLTVSHFTMH